jgi:hypothetical protein
MREGTEVRAAASGVVTAARDGMPDLGLKSGAEVLEGRDCGNGVVIDHGDGWETQYCHMRRTSIAVEPGTIVEAGNRLGEVGLSDRTEFPHLHISLWRGGEVVDPLAGTEGPPTCGSAPSSLWNRVTLEGLGYRGFDLFNAGFAGEAPDQERIRNGAYRHHRLPASAGALVLWAEVYGVEKGDRLAFTIIAPDGTEFSANEQVIPKRQACRFGFSGRKRPANGWPPGIYQGRVTLDARERRHGARPGTDRRNRDPMMAGCKRFGGAYSGLHPV